MTLDNLLHEDRRFPPPADLAANANVTADTYAEAEADFDGFWADQAKRLSWHTEPTRPRLEQPAVRQMVRRRHPERRVQLPRPARRGGQR